MSRKVNQQNAPAGFQFIKELGGIREYELESNGLTVLLRHDDAAPVVTLMVTYRVGSRNEATGHTGATHLLEHMMFKGTPTFNKEKGTQIAAELQRVGALLNATTWFDRTNYYEILPSDQLELAMRIEADRMRNSMIRDEDRRSEMTVVRNEFDISDNRPERVLHDRLFAHAYLAHPYHHSTIGWRSDIEGVSTERLREFYDTYYWPNNATLSVIGDFAEPGVFELIRRYFGAIPRSPHPMPEVYTKDPPQQGEVRFKIRRVGQLGIVAVAHKIPEALHPDMPALDLLSSVLSAGKSSRFYKAIIDENLGLSQYTHAYQLRDPSLLISQVTLSPRAEHREVEDVLLNGYAAIIEKGVSGRELEIARNQIIAEIAYDRDGTYAYASRLNEAIASATWEHYVTYLDKLAAVKPEDLQRVAATYLVEDQRVIGYFEPLTTDGEPVAVPLEEGVPGPAAYASRPFATGAAAGGNLATSISFANRVHEIAGPAGGRCLMLQTKVEKVVSFRGALKAGEHFASKEKALVARLTAGLLDHGTKRRDKFALAEELEHLGAEISFGVGTFDLKFQGRFLAQHLEKVTGLLAEMLREPAFALEEFNKVKAHELARLRKWLESSAARAENMLSSRLFREDHPYFPGTLEERLQQLDAITLDDVQAFYRQAFGGENLLFVVVGDIDESQVQQAFQQNFGDWRGGLSVPDVPRLAPGPRDTLRHAMPDKANVDIYFGQTGVPRPGDDDYLPLSLANNVLGDSALTSRLGLSIRDTQGLTYSIYSFISSSNFADGMWGIYMAVSPEDLEKAQPAVLQELNAFVQEGVTAEEIENQKRTMIGKYKVYNGLHSGALASQILYVVNEGLGLEYMDGYEEKVRATTPEAVNAAIRKYLHPDRLVVAMAGGLKES